MMPLILGLNVQASKLNTWWIGVLLLTRQEKIGNLLKVRMPQCFQEQNEDKTAVVEFL